MKTSIFAMACAGAALLLSSCISAAVGAATAATSAVGGSTAMSAMGLSSLMGNGAPQSMEGHTVSFTGTECAGQYTFPKGVASNIIYTRTGDKTATLSCTDEESTDLYHMTFTSASAGTYAVESTAVDGNKTFGHGSFTIK